MTGIMFATTSLTAVIVEKVGGSEKVGSDSEEE
jgi:hypothetical protein